MGKSEILGIILLVIMSVLLIMYSVTAASSYRSIQEAEVKVKVKNKKVIVYIVWTFISLINIMVQLFQINNALEDVNLERAKFYLYLTFCWGLSMILWGYLWIFCRYVYVTPQTILSMGRSASKLSSENMAYRLNDNDLEIYVKKRKFPDKYTVIGEKEKLLDILEHNYKLFGEPESSSESDDKN